MNKKGIIVQGAQDMIAEILKNAGIHAQWHPILKLLILLFLLGSICVLVYLAARQIILRVVHAFVVRTKSQWDDALMKHKVFRSFAHLLPVLLVKLFIADIFIDFPGWIPFLITITDVYLILAIVKILISFLKGIESFLSELPGLKDKPLASYFQLTRIILYMAAAIFALSILMGRSPLYFLSAFGAMTAIILLIFKDTILGLVASVQLSANDMVRVGDWIEMPKFNADGDVIAINLNTVKVVNWDKTITTIPTFYLITESFKNWRGMQESGGRRIKRSLYINVRSIKFVDPDLRERFKKFTLIKDFIEQRQSEIENYNTEHQIDTTELINGRRMTNIGIFRYYTEAFLRNHKGINQNMLLLVRHLAPGEHGLPLEIYCFTATIRWVEYEPIQADIFDHLLAAAPYFDLEIFQDPSGSDLTHAAKYWVKPTTE